MAVFKTSFSTTEKPITLVNTFDSTDIPLFENTLVEIFGHFNNCKRLVVLCIGSDRCTGDSLGPFVGNFLSEQNHQHIHIFGTVDNPVHALNLHEITLDISYKYGDAAVLAVDAGLGKQKNVGMLEVGEGSLVPGAAVQKKLPPVGDLHITAIVNTGGYMDFAILQTTRLSMVIKMARFIARGINNAAFNTDWLAHFSYCRPAK